MRAGEGGSGASAWRDVGRRSVRGGSLGSAPGRIVGAALRLLSVALALVLVPIAPAGAEADGVIARARQASSDGRREEGLAMLEARLAEEPRDVDARLVYGLMLSWDRRYDDARRELAQVLAQTPSYTDARVALMNVEWWTGHDEVALAYAREILSERAHHPQASLVEQRLGGGLRPWTATASYLLDWFDDAREPWHEYALSVKRATSLGSVILRANHAERFGLSDQLIELEMYPSFRAGTYGYVAIGVGTQEVLYPTYRLGLELYQSLPWSFEVSAGYRRLQFTNATDIYVGSLSKYLGNWMLTARVYYVPAPGNLDSTSYHGSVRRYFGTEGTNFVGLRYSHGLSREEVRSAEDLVDLDSDSLTAQIDTEVYGRFRLALSTGFSRQERATRAELWQLSFGASVGVRF